MGIRIILKYSNGCQTGGKAFCRFVTIYAPTHFTSLKNTNDTPNGSLKEIIIHLGSILVLHHYYYHFRIQCGEST